MKATTFVLVLLLALGCGVPVAAWAAAPTGTPTNGTSQPPQNGVYAVLDRSTSPTLAPRKGTSQVVLLYDRRKYSDAPPDAPPVYVTVDRNAFVPAIIEGTPELLPGSDGRHVLRISSAHDQAKMLEDFTRAHLGGLVATVLDEEIITLHKIRSVIVDGKVQISRCTDDACTVLYEKLIK